MSTDNERPTLPIETLLRAKEILENMGTREYAVRICEGCIKLKGHRCYTPECAFYLKTMAEVADLLEVCQLRYVIDGEVIDLHESAIVEEK